MKIALFGVRRSVVMFLSIATVLAVLCAAGFFMYNGLKKAHIADYQVAGENYEICNEQSQYLTSPWTYSALGSGEQTYTVAQYEALPGYGTTLPPLPSYISSQASTTEAAAIFAPGSTTNQPAYDFPETPILYFFEGGTYGPLGLASISGDEFIGGSANGYGEPQFDDGGNADGIDAGNGSHYFSGGSSTLAAIANSGSSTITTTSSIPGFISKVTFADGSTYGIATASGTSITLSSPLTATESSGSQVWANVEQPLAEAASSASQGGTTLTLTSSSIPLVQYASIVIGSDTYTITSVSGNESGYTIGVAGLDSAVAANTPIYYNAPAGSVTVSYLNIAHDSHNTTGTIYTGTGWTITHNDIHDGYMNAQGTPTPGDGVALYGGDQGTIEYNCLSRMGDYGINAFGTNNTFDYNEIYESNYEPDPGCGCSGGGKWWGTLNANIVDNSFINDSPVGGTPVWLDNGNSGTLIQGNFFNMSYTSSIASETGFNLDVTGNLFEDGGWGSGTGGCGGNNNCNGAININTSGGAQVPGSRYENSISISSNYFVNDWQGIDIWQAGGRSCENSGEGWPDDAPYCSGGFPNTATTAGGGQYYFSHTGDTAHGGTTTVAQSASSGSSTVEVVGTEAIDDQIGFADPTSTTTTDTTSVTTFSGSGTINASTSGFPSSGQLRVGTSAAWSDGKGSWTGAILSYTNTTAGTFTGVSLVRGTGTLSGPIQQVQPYKVTAETCYANDCNLSITPSLSSNESSGTEVSNAGTCQLYATSTATPSSPMAPSTPALSYWDGCQWEAKDITVTGNTFVFQPSVIASSAPLTGGGTSTACRSSNTDFCGTNFMAYQVGGEAPFLSQLTANAMVSSSSFTTCPTWDSGCTSDPLNNLNALSSPPGVPAGNGMAADNDVWSNNTYYGPWSWSDFIYGNCNGGGLVMPDDPATGKSLTATACTTNFSTWQSDWQQDQGSTSSNATPPSTPSNVTATANGPTSVNVSWSASTDAGGPGLGGYYLYRNGVLVTSLGAGTTNYNDTGLTAGTQYSYVVIAYDSASPQPTVSNASSTVNVTTPLSSVLSCTSPSGTGNSLAWYDGTALFGFSGLTGYNTASTVSSGYSLPSWAGVGQYSGSKNGIFWYDPNTTTIYYINGSSFANAQAVRGPGIGAPTWACVGDFTGDGRDDSIAWYSGGTLYLLAGPGLATKTAITGYSSPAWAGVGDYNHDGKDDLYWYLGSTGTIYVMTSNGSSFNGAAQVRGPGIGSPTWAGIGNFSGNGYRDALAWYDGSTLYTFEGPGLNTSGAVSGYSPPEWMGVGQWSNNTSKDGLYWYLSNGTVYGLSSDGSAFYGAATLRGPGVGAPEWAGTGQIY
ncbi:MAG TPA: fibronectin type III domain-containing protein [Candidatus Saccharimonadales bacterium]|nr:fibronectin type III domain-containing protein [Candidatus Saccharimonadales bacterium]